MNEIGQLLTVKYHELPSALGIRKLILVLGYNSGIIRVIKLVRYP